MVVPQPWNDETTIVEGIPQREFHEFSVRHGVYCIPVDDEEEQRLNELHDILRDWNGGPISRLVYPEGFVPRWILDCGCGNGVWANDMLSQEEYEECEILGVDLYLAGVTDFLTKRWNLNAPFRLDQVELSRDRYDLINSRFVGIGIERARWPSFVQDLFDRLKPGGWLQMAEAYMNIQSDSGRREEAVNIGRWWELFSTAMDRQGKDSRVGTIVTNPNQRAWTTLADLLRSAGFTDIQIDQPRLPIGVWPSDNLTREIGRRTKAVAKQTLESLGVWACCKVHGMATEDFQQLLQGCLREMEDNSLRLYIQLYVVWGQKAARNQMPTNQVKEPRSSSSQSMPPPSQWRR